MNPDAFLANAERMFLFHNGIPDASASRAIAHACYYSVYHLVVAGFNLNIHDKSATNHGEVERRILRYQGSDLGLMAAARYITSLKSARIDADYRLNGVIDHEIAKQSLSRAKRIFRSAGITPAIV